jgi:hypothetical protein
MNGKIIYKFKKSTTVEIKGYGVKQNIPQVLLTLTSGLFD